MRHEAGCRSIPRLRLLAAAPVAAMALGATSAGAQQSSVHAAQLWGVPGGLLSAVTMLAFLAGTVLLALMLYNWLRGEEQRAMRSALDILKERYARGEIDRAEFEERRNVLAE